MSDATLSQLRTRLVQRMSKPLPTGTWPDPEAMRRAEDRVVSLLSGAAPDQPGLEHLASAVERLRAGELLIPLDLRVCCAGASTPVAGLDGEQRIIDDDQLTDALLDQVAKADQRSRRKLAFGLGHAYLLPVERPGAGSAANAARCAEFVVRYVDESPDDHRLRRSPELLAGLREVFVADRTEQFWPYVLESSRTAIIPIDRLGVPSTSWLWRKIALDAVAQAAAQLDEHFLNAIDRILTTVTEIAVKAKRDFLLDEVLGEVLKRLARCKKRGEHKRVRELSIDRWGSPLIAANHPRWLRWTSEQGRKLVAGWLARRIIGSFFETLTGGSGDPARARFWSRYAEAADEFRVYPSQQARWADPAAVRDMRAALGPLVRDGDDEQTSIFIMVIGTYAFVEFSTTGHALYVYASDDVPTPPTGRRRPAAFRDQSEAVDRLVHSGAWQERAYDLIGYRTGVWPGP